MPKFEKIFLFLNRLSLGWLMFYAGITKILNPQWTAAGYLNQATTFPKFFRWLASPANIGWVNFINEWALTLLGVSLILGIGIKFSAPLGAILMFLYYLPILKFPYVGHGFLVDEHIIYALLLLYLSARQAGQVWGLDAKLSQKSTQ